MNHFKIVIGLIVIGIIGAIVYEVAWFSSKEEITITVTDKERITESHGSGDNLSVESKFLVYTESETFENTDVTFLGKWNSSDVQGHLKAGETYTVIVYGWRMPFWSSYRNIVEIK